MNTPCPPKRYDAILLAGEGESSYKVYHQHKAFLRLEEKCIVNHVIEALQQVPSIQGIYVIGKKDTLRETLDEDHIDRTFPKPIVLLQQQENLYKNIWHAFLATLPEPVPDTDHKPSAYHERAVLIVPCDAPLITPHEVEYFIRLADMDRYDHVLGLTPEASLEPFYPRAGEPGIRMAYLHMQGANFRINNLHLVKPLKIGNRGYVQEMYQYRYQRNIRNVIPFALKLLGRDRRRGYRFYLGLILSLLFSQLGIKSLVEYFRSWVSKEGLEQWISQGLNTRFNGLEVPFPGAALDIDNEADFEAMRRRFHDWKKTLQQLEAAHPLPGSTRPPVRKASPSPARTPFKTTQLT
ncbi:MAG: nucleotidyltransferase family protein [Nitrospinaceae bacterium]